MGHRSHRNEWRTVIPAFRTADSLLWAERCDSLLPEQLDSGAGMSAAIGLRQDFDAGTLRRMAAQVKDADQARRLLALAAVYDGMARCRWPDQRQTPWPPTEAFAGAERGITVPRAGRPRSGEGRRCAMALRGSQAGSWRTFCR